MFSWPCMALKRGNWEESGNEGVPNLGLETRGKLGLSFFFLACIIV